MMRCLNYLELQMILLLFLFNNKKCVQYVLNLNRKKNDNFICACGSSNLKVVQTFDFSLLYLSVSLLFMFCLEFFRFWFNMCVILFSRFFVITAWLIQFFVSFLVFCSVKLQLGGKKREKNVLL